MATIRELVTKLKFVADNKPLKDYAVSVDNLRAKFKLLDTEADRAVKKLDQVGKVSNKAFPMITVGVIAMTTAIGGAGYAILKMNDRINLAIGRIGILTRDTAHARANFEELAQVSIRTGAHLDDITRLFGGIAASAPELGATTKDVMELVEGISQLTILSGGGGAATQGALLQLSQLFAGPRVQAQEYNSLIDGTPALLDAVARAMGKTRGQLTLMVKAQELSTKEFYEALKRSLIPTNKLFKQMPLTLDRVINKFQVMGLVVGLKLQKQMKIPSQFLVKLDKLIDRTQVYILANKELVGLGIEAVFKALGVAVDVVEVSFKTFVDTIKLAKENADFLKIALVALTGATIAYAIDGLAWSLPAIWAQVAAWWALNAAMLANPATWITIGFVALGAIIAVMIYKWKEITAAVKMFCDSSYKWIMEMVAKTQALMPAWMKNLFSGGGSATINVNQAGANSQVVASGKGGAKTVVNNKTRNNNTNVNVKQNIKSTQADPQKVASAANQHLELHINKALAGLNT